MPLIIDTSTDYSGRGRAALEAIFDGMLANIRYQAEQEQKARTYYPELPEPMDGPMRSDAA